MESPAVSPFGAWQSVLNTETIFGDSLGFVDLLITSSKDLVWLEGRTNEKGRNAIVSRSSATNQATEVIPDQAFNARTRVHEYGGASVAIVGDSVIFSDFASNSLFRTDLRGNAPLKISPESCVYRYADFSAHPQHPHLLVAILEDHTKPLPADVVNSVILLNTKTKSFIYLAQGNDFYAAPRFNCDGSALCYIEWSHPNMPWNDSKLSVINLVVKEDGTATSSKNTSVAGGGYSVSQPRWEIDGEHLVFLSDATGFYELYLWKAEAETRLVLDSTTGSDVGGPDWTLGASTHASIGAGQWIAKAKNGDLRLLDLGKRSSTILPTRFSSIFVIRVIDAVTIAVIAGSSSAPDEIALISLDSGIVDTVKLSSTLSLAKNDIAIAEAIMFPAAEGDAYGWYYAPTSSSFVGPNDELPPLIVHCHGGPTSAAGSTLKLGIQYYTSRGFAYVDVNYGGSTGYGRTYRERLDTNWGIVDVSDTIACVKYLIKEGRVDAKRIAITGGSAGGFTVLAALCDSRVFTAGVSLYGVSDLALLAGETHKFESQYLFNLVGGTPEEVPQIYHRRSPINKAFRITAPVLLLQGEDDKIVPPSQATMMEDLIKRNGGVASTILFPGEGHGFRSFASKQRATLAEIGWYRDIWGVEGGN